MKNLRRTTICYILACLLLIGAIVSLNYYIDFRSDIKALQTQLDTKTETINNLSIEKDREVQQLLKIQCRYWNVDYKLAYAIAKLETGNFSSDLFLEYNNIGGMRCGTWLRYSTLNEGVTAYVSMLYNNWISKGLNTPQLINPNYCEGSEWQKQVEEIMEEVN